MGEDLAHNSVKPTCRRVEATRDLVLCMRKRIAWYEESVLLRICAESPTPGMCLCLLRELHLMMLMYLLVFAA